MQIIQQELYPTAPLHSEGPYVDPDIDGALHIGIMKGGIPESVAHSKVYMGKEERLVAFFVGYSPEFLEQPSSNVPELPDVLDVLAPRITNADTYLSASDGPADAALCRCVEIESNGFWSNMPDNLGEFYRGDEERHLCFNYTPIKLSNTGRQELRKLRTVIENTEDFPTDEPGGPPSGNFSVAGFHVRAMSLDRSGLKIDEEDYIFSSEDWYVVYNLYDGESVVLGEL
jgi:hypothetical protein